MRTLGDVIEEALGKVACGLLGTQPGPVEVPGACAGHRRLDVKSGEARSKTAEDEAREFVSGTLKACV